MRKHYTIKLIVDILDTAFFNYIYFLFSWAVDNYSIVCRPTGEVFKCF